MNNFTNNRWLTIITILLLTANIVTLALLWTNKKAGKENYNQPPPLPPQQSGQAAEFLTRELKLDSIQQEIYKKLLDEHRMALRPFQDSIGNAKDIFFALLQKQNISDSMVETYSKKIGNLEQQRDVFTFRHFQKLRAICTKDQQARFDNIIQEAIHRMAPARNPGPPPGRERPVPGGRNNDGFKKQGMKPDGQRPPPPDAMRHGDERLLHPPGMGPGNEHQPPPPGMRPPPGEKPPHPGEMRPGERPARKDSM